MDTLPFNFEQLPYDKQCEVVSHVTDVKTIMSLMQTSPHLREVTKDCITVIGENTEDGEYEPVPLELVLALPRVKVVYGLIIFHNLLDLLTIANNSSLKEAH